MAYTSGSLSGANLEIGIALVLQDRFSNQAREASAQLRKLHMDAKNAIQANLTSIQEISRRGFEIAQQATAGMTSAVLEGASFIDTMVTVKAITNATNEEFKSLSEVSKSLGIKTMFDANEIASGMKYLAMAGVQAREIEDMIKGSAMVANATGMQLGGKGGAADMITNVMRMFNIDSTGASMVGDQLTKATLSSNMSMTDLAEAIKYAGADMVTLKQSLPSVAAMIGTLGNAGIQGSMAGTAISNMARYLNKSISQPEYKGAKALASIGLGRNDMVNAKGDLIDISLVLEKILAASSKLTSTEQNALFLDMFGVRGNRGATAIARDLIGYRDLLNKITNESAGFAEDVVGQRMASLAGSIDKVTSTWQNLKISFTTSIAPALGFVLDQVAAVIDGFRYLFDMPVVGPLIGGLMVGGVVLLGIISKVALLRSTFLLFKSDSQVSTKVWFDLLRGRWSGVIMQAREYMGIQAAIIAQQKAGIGGNVGYMALATSRPGQWIGNSRMTLDKHGRKLYWVRNSNGGVVRATPAAAAAAAGQNFGRDSINAAVNNLVPGAQTRTFTGRLIGIGSKFLGLFGGPIGIAIMGLSMGLPWLIGKLSNDTDSRDKNTNSVDKLNETMTKDLISRTKDSELMAQRKLTLEMQNLAEIIRYWGIELNKDKGNGSSTNIKIDLDGKPIYDIVDKAMRDKDTNDNYNNNLR